MKLKACGSRDSRDSREERVEKKEKSIAQECQYRGKKVQQNRIKVSDKKPVATQEGISQYLSHEITISNILCMKRRRANRGKEPTDKRMKRQYIFID